MRVSSHVQIENDITINLLAYILENLNRRSQGFSINPRQDRELFELTAQTLAKVSPANNVLIDSVEKRLEYFAYSGSGLDSFLNYDLIDILKLIAEKEPNLMQIKPEEVKDNILKLQSTPLGFHSKKFKLDPVRVLDEPKLLAIKLKINSNKTNDDFIKIEVKTNLKQQVVWKIESTEFSIPANESCSVILNNYEEGDLEEYNINPEAQIIGELLDDFTKNKQRIKAIIEKGYTFDIFYERAINMLGVFGLGDSEAILELLQTISINSGYENDDYDSYFHVKQAIYSLIQIADKPLMQSLVKMLQQNDWSGVELNENFQNSEPYYELLWQCAQNMSYPDFYKAWHSQPTTSHPEATEIIPVGDTPTTQTLNQQLTDLASQLQSTATTYPIVIDLGTLAGETEQSAISQKICNLLYSANVFPDSVDLPPEVNNASQLERQFFRIKRHVETKKIVLILQNQQPYPELIDFCHQLSSTVDLVWITDQQQPFKGFPPQPNLAAILQNWISELG